MSVRRPIGLLACVLLVSSSAAAEDFDGSKPLLCAPVEVVDCVAGIPCVAGLPEQFGAPSFLRIDFGGKTVTGPHAQARIASVQKSESQLLLQGVEIGHAFAIALDRATGHMTATLNDSTGAFVLFGSCTTR